jgi:hypothetical protein
MAVMSFAHLKPSREFVAGITATSVPAPQVDEKKADQVVTPGVMSFAHLRPGGKQVQPKVPEKVEVKVAVNRDTKIETSPTPQRTTYRIPAILPTARLSAVNYCRGCSRFLSATPWEKTVGVPYGRCRRDDEVIEGGDMGGTGNVVRRAVEVWKIIPAGATVVRCWYWMKETKEK